MTETLRWTPEWLVAPGEVLVEALEERGMSQAELGRRMARPLKTISEIATGKAAITPETAIQLERTLGITAAMWLGLEARYREAQAREREAVELEEHVTWLKRFPMRELLSRGIVRRDSSTPQQAAELLSFFGVSNPSGWAQHWGQIAASYRMSRRTRVSRFAVALWLRTAEREAESQPIPAFDRNRLRAIAPALRSLSRALVLGSAVDEAKEVLKSAGAGLLLIEGVTDAPASGAVRWVRGNPWIILTLRHKTDDQLWFSLLHEIGHLLEGIRRQEVAEELPVGKLADPAEKAADDYAREILLPEAELKVWLRNHSIDRQTIRDLAASQGVAPGIVVGRLQRDGLIEPARFNDLKRSLDPRG
ncbi:MAG: HigA family addiction module antidote protein [Chloroflexi bacterium]|nr:HigA family addiction module antidote protein [Chloroflexota bacterium]